MSCSPAWLWICYAAENNLEFLIALPPLPECWDLRCVLVYVKQGTDPRTLCVLGKYSTNWANPSAQITVLNYITTVLPPMYFDYHKGFKTARQVVLLHRTGSYWMGGKSGLSFRGVNRAATGTTILVASSRLDGQTFQLNRTPSRSSFCWMNSK